MRIQVVLLTVVLGIISNSHVYGAMVKTGSTCVVTPISETAKAAKAAAAVAARGILGEDVAGRGIVDTIPQTEGDVNPDDIWKENDPFSNPKPGSPGALGHYPRPEPGLKKNKARSLDFNEKEEEEEEEGEEEEGKEAVAVMGPRQNRPDDTPQILEAFKQCRQDSTIIIKEGTYQIRQVMNTTDLRNVSIELHDTTFIWSADNISYWRQRCFSVTYAGRCTAWLFGGRDVSMRGFGKVLFNGNGQTWIDLAKGEANLNGRPISLTVWRGTNIFIDGITWRMAQFWHTFIAHSQNVTMTNMDMSTWTNSQYKSVNTDGTNTWNSRDVRIANWTVKCGDVSAYLHIYPLGSVWRE